MGPSGDAMHSLVYWISTNELHLHFITVLLTPILAPINMFWPKLLINVLLTKTFNEFFNLNVSFFLLMEKIYCYDFLCKKFDIEFYYQKLTINFSLSKSIIYVTKICYLFLIPEN
jgi:hypothetical protein